MTLFQEQDDVLVYVTGIQEQGDYCTRTMYMTLIQARAKTKDLWDWEKKKSWTTQHDFFFSRYF